MESFYEGEQKLTCYKLQAVTLTELDPDTGAVRGEGAGVETRPASLRVRCIIKVE